MAYSATTSPARARIFGRTGVISQALNQPLTSYYLILVAASLLVGLGLMMVLSASSVFAQVATGDPYYIVKRQAVFLLFGVLGTVWLSRLSPETLRRLGWVGIFVAFALLLLTFTPLGDEANGNRNWLQFGSSLLRFQPSEFAKLAMVVWGADVLARKDKLLRSPGHILFPFVPVCVALIGLVMAQHDLGTAMVMGAMMMAVLFIVGTPLRILVGMVSAVAAVVVTLVITSGNRMDRIFGFLNPGTEALGINQQPLRAVFALASGGWWGLGLGASRQKWGMLAEAHTDFVFAVIGEELGLLGTLLVIGLFLVLGYGGFRVALRSDTPFARYTAAGVTSWFMIQALVNIAVVLRMVPVFGVPLPFVSYGGSALLANLAALGILLACARQEPAARRLLEQRRTAKGSRRRLSTVVQGRKAS